MAHDEAWQLRGKIYDQFATTGTAPDRAQLAEWCGDDDLVDTLLAELHDRHAVVLDQSGEIRMALPFSAVPTDHCVVAESGSWWANCAWDSLAIPAALGVDAVIEASWMDSGEPVDLEIRNGAPTHTDGFVHFVMPAKRWWDDIVET